MNDMMKPIHPSLPNKSPFLPVQTISGNTSCGLLIICDHAANNLPPQYESLGLPPEQLERHIGYDIGATNITEALAKYFNAPAIMSTFSRLLIDPNRGYDDPTLIMQLSDGAIIPGNANLDKLEKQHRITTYYAPYHKAIEQSINEAINSNHPPAILSIHSFTPVWREKPRPWHAGILWDKDPRFAAPITQGLRKHSSLIIGDNEPYSGALKNDTLYRHGTQKGLAHALIEIRQDLINNARGVQEWVERLVPIIEQSLTKPGLHSIHHYGSQADRIKEHEKAQDHGQKNTN